MLQDINSRILFRRSLNVDKRLGTGNFKPGNILIIAEEHNHSEIHTGNEPFNSAVHCSGWLNRLLDQEQIDERYLFWINARMNGGIFVDVNALAQELKPSTVITLGNIAHIQCVKFGIEHVKIYHPQYWKRFRSKEKYPLLDILRVKISELESRKI